MVPPLPRLGVVARILVVSAAFVCLNAAALANAPKDVAKDAPKNRHPAADPGRCFLWKVTSPTNTVYLLGSIHVAREDFYPLPEEIEKAFDRSETLVLEVDLEKANQGDAQFRVLQKAMYPRGETLSENLGKETRDALKAYCERKGLPMAQLEPVRPWLVSLTILMSELQETGFRPELGIDMHFANQAKAQNKPVLELESAEFQIDLLSGFSDELQEEFLASTLREVADLKQSLDELAEIWKAGDAEALLREMIEEPLREEPEMKPVMQKLLDDRNVKMAGRIEEFLADDEPYFVVVGAAHLVGEQGLVRLLEQTGKYRLEQVRVANPPAARSPRPAGPR